MYVVCVCVYTWYTHRWVLDNAPNPHAQLDMSLADYQDYQYAARFPPPPLFPLLFYLHAQLHVPGQPRCFPI